MLPAGLQEPRSPQTITYGKLLIVEGHTAFQFFKALLRHLGLLSVIEIRNTGGNEELPDYLPTLTGVSGFRGVQSLGIVRDAEKDAVLAFNDVQRALREAGLPVPTQPTALAPGRPTVSVFILPDCTAPGMLETLCWQAVRDDPATLCVDDYFRCLQERSVKAPVSLPKAYVHAFLASRPRPELLVGQAAHEGYWPWDHPAFDPLKVFLRAL
jgi:hypothetical protein